MPESFEKTTIDRLARIEEGVKQLLDGKGDHETRIRRLEKFGLLLAGGLMVLGGSLGRVAGVI